MKIIIKVLVCVFVAVVLSGCVNTGPYDYTALKNAKPRSILVVPPLTDATDVNSTYTFLSTISKPLVEKGYYVFPVAVIDTLLKENGLPTPGEMNSVSLEKLYEATKADAILYVHILDWGQKFHLISSVTVVKSQARLVDAKTGGVLWEATIYAEQNPNNNSGGGLLGAVISAVANQIAGSMVDSAHMLSAQANYNAIYNANRGLLSGPYYKYQK